MIQELLLLLVQYGLPLVFLNVLLEQIGLPVPAIPTLVIAGALAAEGKLSAGGVFLVALLACYIGDLVWYAAGRIYGNRVMKLLCKISLSPDSCVNQTQSRFERWGVGMLVVAKFVPGLSTIAPPLAGATRLPLHSFLFFNGIGASLWVIAGLGAGMLMRREVERVLTGLETMGSAALMLVGALLAAYIALKWWQRRRFYKFLRMARISVDELYALMEAGEKPLVVDVRTAVARQLDPRAIPGALPVEMAAIDRHLADMPTDRDIILYCTCPNEATAAQVAKALMDRGYKRVRPLQGGLDAWVAAGYEVEEQVVSSTFAAA